MPSPVFSEALLARLREVLTYDPNTGIFRRRDGRNRNRPLKDPAKTAKTYKQINVDGEIHNAHILAWWFMTGSPVPDGLEIDHKNRDRRDARWENLRLVTSGRNKNNRTVGSHNKSGIMGVQWNVHDQKWLAHIRVDGMLHGLGGYVRFSDAVTARLAGEMKYLGEIVSTHAVNGLPEPLIPPEKIRARKPDERLTLAYAKANMERRCKESGSPHPGVLRLASGRYQARHRNSVIGSYDTLEEAMKAREDRISAYYSAAEPSS